MRDWRRNQEPAPAARTAEDDTRTPFTTILAFENFLLLMVVIFGLQFADRSFGPVLPLYIGQLGYAPRDVPLVAGTLFSCLAFSGALGNQIAARALKHVSPRTSIAGAVLICAAGLVGAHSISVVFVAGIAALFMLAIIVRRLMVKRNPPVAQAPSVEKS